jgi:hypothetical protein
MTGPRRRKTKLALAATLCAAMLFPAVVAQAQTPSLPSTCAIVAAYEAEHDHAFIDVFDAMVFTRNDCLWEDGSVAPCDFETLRRWSGDLMLRVPRGVSWNDNYERTKQIMHTLDAAMEIVLPSLGLTKKDVLKRSKQGDAKEQGLFVILSTQSEIFDYAAMLDYESGGSKLVHLGRVTASRGPGCWNQSFLRSREDAAMLGGFAFIDIDLPPEQAASCMREQIFKLFVPGNPPGAGFFDDAWRPLEDGAPGAKYSLRDVAVVNLLHNKALTPGMPRADALAAAERILAACP